MKKIVLSGIALVAAVQIAWGEATQQPTKPRRTNRDVMIARCGGMLTRAPENPGKLVIVNAQKSVESSAFAMTLADIIKFNRIFVEVQESDETITFDKAERTLKATGGNAALFIVDNPDYPISLVAVESKWAFLNVAPLKFGAKDASAIGDRTSKELWRVFVMLMGGSDTEMPHCLMRPAFSGNDIEALAVHSISPEPLDKMAKHMEKMGIRQWIQRTYKQACEEGWAPAPTNAIQKAIWNKVHQLPTKPITIKPETKPVKR